MKKWIKRILAALLILVLVCVLAFCGLYLGRFKTLASIRKVSAYEDGYNLYRMDIKYDYSLDDIIASGITNDPNDWAQEQGKPRYILDLLLSVITVSLRTKNIVKSLPSITLL